jgi:hypothetical protein
MVQILPPLFRRNEKAPAAQGLSRFWIGLVQSARLLLGSAKLRRGAKTYGRWTVNATTQPKRITLVLPKAARHPGRDTLLLTSTVGGRLARAAVDVTLVGRP